MLVVHFVVVAVPVTALVAIVVTLWPRARDYLGWFPPVLGVVTLCSVPIATAAGEALWARQGTPASVIDHASIGGAVILAVGPLALTLAMQWLLGRPRVTEMIDDGDPVLTWLRRLVSLAVLAAAVASVIMVVLAGDSGTRAVWG